MRVAIAGAGAVGRSIAQALLTAGHKVLLIERQRSGYRPDLVPDADWMLADACELGALRMAGIDSCDVAMAASGDDKVNLVFCLLAKTEFAVPRVVARINHPANHWLFTEAWGIDAAVSTPSALIAAVEEAVVIGDIVRLLTLAPGHGNIFEITLPPESALSGTTLGALPLPDGVACLAILRAGTLVTPDPETELWAGDELIFASTDDIAEELRIRFRAAG